MHSPLGEISNATWQTAAAKKPACWPLRVVLLGDTAREEFRVCVEPIFAHTEATVQTAWRGELACEVEPDLCVVLAARPGEFTAEVVESLRQQAPLTRVVGLLGSWCEGEARTGHPWPAVPRVYWHRWPAWFAEELAAWEQGEFGALSLPLTATDEERLLRADTNLSDRGEARVAISSPLRDMAALLVEACTEFGYRAHRCEAEDSAANPQPVLGIYDAGSCDAEALEQLRRLASDCPATRWLALANFPRVEDERQLREAGAAAVLSQPLVIDELRATLTRLIDV